MIKLMFVVFVLVCWCGLIALSGLLGCVVGNYALEAWGIDKQLSFWQWIATSFMLAWAGGSFTSSLSMRLK